MTYFETSCKTGENVQEFFEQIASDLVRQHNPNLVNSIVHRFRLIRSFSSFSSSPIHRSLIISHLITILLRPSIIVWVKNYGKWKCKRRTARNQRRTRGNSLERMNRKTQPLLLSMKEDPSRNFDFLDHSFVVIHAQQDRPWIEPPTCVILIYISIFIHHLLIVLSTNHLDARGRSTSRPWRTGRILLLRAKDLVGKVKASLLRLFLSKFTDTC